MKKQNEINVDLGDYIELLSLATLVESMYELDIYSWSNYEAALSSRDKKMGEMLSPLMSRRKI